VNIAALGTEWLLWLLLALSILSTQIMLDRAYFFWKRRIDADWLAKQMFHLLRLGEFEKARAIVNRTNAPECIVLAAGLSDETRGPRAVAEAMHSAQARERLRMEGEMNLLAMIATYAPIMGLMGTVLGSVNAMHNMTYPFSDQNLAAAATAGFADALVASAAGLLVSIHAGIGYHLIQRRVQSTIARIGALNHLVLAEMQAGEFIVPRQQPELSRAA